MILIIVFDDAFNETVWGKKKGGGFFGGKCCAKEKMIHPLLILTG